MTRQATILCCRLPRLAYEHGSYLIARCSKCGDKICIGRVPVIGAQLMLWEGK